MREASLPSLGSYLKVTLGEWEALVTHLQVGQLEWADGDVKLETPGSVQQLEVLQARARGEIGPQALRYVIGGEAETPQLCQLGEDPGPDLCLKKLWVVVPEGGVKVWG